jgi:hypothetical protein
MGSSEVTLDELSKSLGPSTRQDIFPTIVALAIEGNQDIGAQSSAFNRCHSKTFSFEVSSSLPVDGVTLKGRVDTFMAALQ